jgi:hypothetical protein
MADRKISDLTALTTPASGDFLPIVDISEAAAATKNKRITIEELMRGMPDGTAAAPGIAFENDPNTGIYSPGADTLAFVEGGVEAMRIDSSGRVGIGTSSPGNLLHVSGTGTVCQLASSNNNNLINLKGNGATNGVWLGTTSSDDFLISSGASISERARIDSSGRLLVGTSTNFDSYLNQVSSTSGSLLSLRRTNSNPGSIKLSSGASGDNVGNNGQLGYLRWYGFHTSTDYEAARISAEVDGTPGAGDMPGRLVFSTTADGASSPTECLRIDSSGRLLVGTSTANTSGAKLQTSDGLTFPATQVASADANTLDDYEEGTWTATIVGTTTAGTATYAAQTGNYTKVGRAVSIVLYIAWSGHTGTGNMNLHGLPFTSTSGNNSAGVTIGYLNNLALTALNVFSPIIDAGQTKVDFYQSPVGGGAIATVPIDAAAAFALSCTYFV